MGNDEMTNDALHITTRLAVELKNAGYDEAADYMVSDYIRNKYTRAAPAPVDVEGLKRETSKMLLEHLQKTWYQGIQGMSFEQFCVNSVIDHLAARGFGVQEWQPIETYDYENFPLVMLAGFITPSEYAQSNGSKPFWEISIGRCWHVNTRKFTGFLGQQPTHWMPLPAAPKKED